MPVYTYRAVHPEQSCNHCAEAFEVQQGMKEPRLASCFHCGNPIHRIITRVGYVRGLHFGDTMTPERFKASGLRRMVKDDNGEYVDDTPK